MTIPFLDLKTQYNSIKNDIDRAIEDVISKTEFIGGADNSFVKKFEKDFSEYVGTSFCLSCANGTDALELSLMSLGVEKNDEILVPAISWISTSESVTTAGGIPVFVDIDPVTLTIDTNLIEKKINKNTKGIIAVHLYGMPADMPKIMEIAKKYNLFVIEDCAQAHGASIKGKNVGTFGDIATFSFYPGKNLGAYGDAGCVVTNNQDLALKFKMIANHGQIKKHHHQIEGRNSRMDGIQAAILSVKMPYLDTWNKKRIDNSVLYNKLFKNSFVKCPVVPDGFKHVFHLYVIQVEDRDKIQDKLKEFRIESAIHYPSPLPFVDAYKKYNYKIEDFPVSCNYSKKILSLPMYAELSEHQIELIVNTILNYAKA